MVSAPLIHDHLIKFQIYIHLFDHKKNRMNEKTFNFSEFHVKLTHNNRPVLIVGKHGYYRHLVNKKCMIRWRCQRHRSDCKAAVWTHGNAIVKTCKEHNHYGIGDWPNRTLATQQAQDILPQISFLQEHLLEAARFFT